MRKRAAWLVTLVWLSAFAACSRASGGGDCKSVKFSPVAECQACVEQSCCAELSACADGTPCAAAFACMASRGPNDTVAKCQRLDGYADLEALTGCYAASCSMVAACTAGHVCGSGLVLPDEPDCAACLGESCCSPWTDCANDGDCAACAADPTAAGCAENQLHQLATACTDEKCADTCKNGRVCDSGLQNSENPACGDCDGERCCAEFDACVADATCLACITTAPDGEGCASNQALVAVSNCQASSCSDVCK